MRAAHLLAGLVLSLLLAGCDCEGDIDGPPGGDAATGGDGGDGDGGGGCACTRPEECIGGRCRTPHGPCDGADDCAGDDHCVDGRCVDWDDGETDRDCSRDSEPGRVRPELQCAWAGPPVGGARETAVRVMHTPLTMDLQLPEDPDAPQGPAIVFASDDSYREGVPRVCESHGILRVVDGATCAERFALADPADVVNATVTPAIAELDGAAPPEIVAAAADGGLVAFAYEPDSASFVRRWRSTEADGSPSQLGGDACLWGALSIHDLDDDGSPEIVFEGSVHDADGVRRGAWPYVYVTHGNPPVVADVDLDGRPEIVEAYGTWEYAGGAVVQDAAWVGPGGVNGFVAVADFGDFPGNAGDAAGRAEVVVAGNGEVRLQTLAGVVLWRRTGLSTGGPPTVADFDGDGRPEIGVAFGDEYAVFDRDCDGAPPGCAADGVLWRSPSQDLSSARTGSSVFDFNGDGRAEVVYGDECFLRVYDGPTGEVVFSQGRFSSTWHENAIVADVDGDFSAEIVLPASSTCNPGYCPLWDPNFVGLACDGDQDCPGGPCTDGRCRCADDAACGTDFGCDTGTCRTRHENCAPGVRVYRDALDRWAASRAVWNQHAYSVTNVGDDGAIPRSSEWARNWQDPALNNFRQNVQGGVGPVPAPDLTVRLGEATCDPGSGEVTFAAEVCNRGAARGATGGAGGGRGGRGGARRGPGPAAGGRRAPVHRRDRGRPRPGPLRARLVHLRGRPGRRRVGRGRRGRRARGVRGSQQRRGGRRGRLRAVSGPRPSPRPSPRCPGRGGCAERVALLLAAAVAAGVGACARPAVREEAVRIAPGQQGVLFVGNSLTFHNDLPGTVAALARAAGGPLLDVRTTTIPGGTLEDAWEKGRATALIGAARWSAVVLQEQSERPIRDPDAMEKAAVRLADRARLEGAKVVSYGTWPDRRRPETGRALSRTFAKVARAAHGEVAPAGAAWAIVGARAPRVALWAEDGVHPTPAGTYLAACVLYGTLTDRSPVGVPHRTVRASTDGITFRPVTIGDAEAALLQRAAAEALGP